MYGMIQMVPANHTELTAALESLLTALVAIVTVDPISYYLISRVLLLILRIYVHIVILYNLLSYGSRITNLEHNYYLGETCIICEAEFLNDL